MAIAFNSSQDGTSTASTITTPQLGFAIAADLYTVVVIGLRPNTATVTSVGDALGRSYTQRARVTHATSQTLAVEVWTSDTPSTALSDGWFASATMSGSPTKSGIVALNYSGVGSIGSTFPTATGAAGSNPSVSLTPTATTSYAVMGACVSGVGTFAANTGTLRETIQTTGGSGGSNHCTLGNDRTGVTPEVNTVTATSAGHWAAAAVELKVPSGLTEGTGAAAGIGALTSLAAALWNSLASAAGVGTPTAVGRWFSLAVVSSAGTATPTATAATVLAGSGASAGTSTASSTAATGGPTMASAAGVGTVTGTASAIGATAGSAAGLGTPAASSAVTAGSVATATGSGTATGDGLAIGPVETTGTAAGTGAASAASALLRTGVGTTSGTGAAAATAAVRITTAGSSAGVATVAASAASVLSGAGQAMGAATVTGESVTPAAETTGSSAGVATITGAASWIGAAAGAAAGLTAVTATTSVRVATAGSSAGAAAVAAMSGAVAGSLAGAAGTATAAGATATLAVVGRDGLAAGIAAVAATSSATAGVEATATGTATAAASGAGLVYAASDAEAAGTSTAAALAATIVPGDGTAAGAATGDGQSGPANLIQEQTPLLAIRAAVLAQLAADTELAALLYGPTGRDLEDPVRIGYRPRQIPVIEPSVTFFDFGAWDPVLPVTRLSLHIDIWDTDLDHAEEIAERIRTLLDFQWCRMAGITPTSIPIGGPARIDHLGVDVDRSDLLVESEEGDIAQQRVDFLLIATALE